MARCRRNVYPVGPGGYRRWAAKTTGPITAQASLTLASVFVLLTSHSHSITYGGQHNHRARRIMAQQKGVDGKVVAEHNSREKVGNGDNGLVRIGRWSAPLRARCDGRSGRNGQKSGIGTEVECRLRGPKNGLLSFDADIVQGVWIVIHGMPRSNDAEAGRR